LHHTSNDISWQEACIQSLLTANTEAEFFAVLAMTAAQLGFQYCAYGMRMPLPLSRPKTLLLNNYSKEWQERYASQNYLAIDPTVAHGMSSVRPMVWAEKVSPSSQEFWDDARAHGLKAGWAQSSFDAKGVAGMLTLARSEDDLSAAEVDATSLRLSWLVQAAHEGLSRLISQRSNELPIQLTQREVEVLRWTADGKTSGEVGQIMNISERTVNFHVNNAIEKLGTANKTAAVIKAALLHLL
jgi:LuxR family quorum-sensing system transcriptional regulator SolR